MGLTTVRRGARAASRRRSAGGGSPAFRTSARGNDENTGNDTTCTITVPGTVQNGDVMLIAAAQHGTSQTFSISGGGSGATWATRQGPDTTSDNTLCAQLWSARATGSSAGSTITVTSNQSRRFPGLLWVGSGVTDTGIVTAAVTNSTTTSSHVFPSVTVPSPGGYALVGLGVLRKASDIVPTLSGGMPAGATLDDESNTAAPASPNITVSGLHTTSTVAAGSRTPGTATSATTCASTVLYTIALAPG